MTTNLLILKQTQEIIIYLKKFLMNNTANLTERIKSSY